MFRSSASRQLRHSAVLFVMFSFAALEVAYSLGLPPTPPNFALPKNFRVETISRVVLPDGDVLETRSLSASDPITSIEITGGGITVEVTCQQDQGLQVIGDPDMVRTVETDVDDGQLQISGASWRSGKKGVVVRVSVQTLEDIEMSGANVIKVVRLNANQLDVEMSGACSLDVAGKARKFNVEASGACIVNAKDLIAEKNYCGSRRCIKNYRECRKATLCLGFGCVESTLLWRTQDYQQGCMRHGAHCAAGE